MFSDAQNQGAIGALDAIAEIAETTDTGNTGNRTRDVGVKSNQCRGIIIGERSDGMCGDERCGDERRGDETCGLPSLMQAA